MPLLKFSTEEEVIERANASLYGLGGQVWDGDLEQCQRIADQLETGTVWINQMQSELFCLSCALACEYGC